MAVNEGQCMIIVDQGKVVEFCAEAGEFLYDTSTEPSLLYGDLGENIKKTFAAVGRRFTFGGDTGKDQRVYFFNTCLLYTSSCKKNFKCVLQYGTGESAGARSLRGSHGIEEKSAV